MGIFVLAVVSRNQRHQVTRPEPLQTVASNVGVASMTALQIHVLTGTIGHKQTYRPRNVIRRERRVTDLEPDVPLSADSDSCSAIADIHPHCCLGQQRGD